jgi:hypothetical protein
MMKTYAIVKIACNDEDDVWALEVAIVACNVYW